MLALKLIDCLFPLLYSIQDDKESLPLVLNLKYSVIQLGIMYPNDFYTTKSCISPALIFKSDGYKQPVHISSSCNIYSAEKRCGVGNELYEVITLDLDKIYSHAFR